MLALDLDDLAVERSMLESLRHARSVREVFIVNGWSPATLRARWHGEHVGTRTIREAPLKARGRYAAPSQRTALPTRG